MALAKHFQVELEQLLAGLDKEDLQKVRESREDHAVALDLVLLASDKMSEAMEVFWEDQWDAPLVHEDVNAVIRLWLKENS